MRILFESGLYSNADSICDFTLRHITYFIYHIYTKYYIIAIFKSGHYLIVDCIKITNFLLGLYLSTYIIRNGTVLTTLRDVFYLPTVLTPTVRWILKSPRSRRWCTNRDRFLGEKNLSFQLNANFSKNRPKQNRNIPSKKWAWPSLCLGVQRNVLEVSCINNGTFLWVL